MLNVKNHNKCHNFKFMDNSIKDMLWNQFGACIDMLINAISHCPDDYFKEKKRFHAIAFHSALFLDYYLTIPPNEFEPQLSFTQKETIDLPAEAIGDLIPDRMYDKGEVLDYIIKSRAKCKTLIYSWAEDGGNQRFKEGDEPGDMNYPLFEILLYNIRHTQHHTAQLNLLLRQDLEKHMEWSFRAGDITLDAQDKS